MQIFRNKGFIKTVAQTCPFITIPNGLKQHPLPVGIIHFAQFMGFKRKLPDPSEYLKLVEYLKILEP